jgi:gliding motility-associated-like protein
VGCFPILVSFKDTLQKGITYFWNFDSDNFPNNIDAITNSPDTSHLYIATGIYRVRLISEDSTTCNIRDTSYITITISDRRVFPSFIATRVLPCNINKYTFENTSTTFDGTAFVPTSFVWDYGDGSPKDTTNKLPIREHTYASLGTYFVTMTVIDPRFCNAPITDTVKIIVEPNVKAVPDVIKDACAPATYTFLNNSLFATGWEWQFFNEAGTIIGTSNIEEPDFTFTIGGVFRYRLIASNPNTCNLSDTSAFFTVKVIAVPNALFDYAPIPPEPNVPVKFRNLSTNANSYLWAFGDGASSTLFEPSHEYNKTGAYKVTLYAYNNLICIDTAQLVVNVIIVPLLDVPNAFTPGKFGSNGIVYVRGFGIEKMEWKIYNRWGELVFRSTDKLFGWDGFYKGKLQAMDVYTYTLDAQFVDGQKKRQTGDITLLR